MERFFSKFIEGSNITPPDIIMNALIENFPDAINTEWYKRGENFEAIFYKDNIEHIALFDPAGVLVEYRMYLPEGFLPEKIKAELENRGEIMNVVMINKGNSITYEIILRDSKLIRYLLLVNEFGGIVDEKVL